MIKSILVDMDGVLVDFDSGFHDQSGFKASSIKMDEKNGDAVCEWLEQNASTNRFFESLPPMPDFDLMKDLMQTLAFNYEIRILSSCGSYNPFEIQRQKRKWLEDHGLGMVQFNWCEASYQKGFFADPHSVLIDDRLESCYPFSSAGGMYIQHENYFETARKLQELLSPKFSERIGRTLES